MNTTLTRNDLKCIDDAEMAARTNRRIYVPPEDSRYPRNYYPGYFRESEYALLQEFWVPPLHHAMQGMNLVREFANLENHRRATLIILALQAWKLEHGDYPKSLDELVGPYLTQLPNDPYGEAYRYYPHGVKVPLPGTGMDFELLSAVNDKPVIWSTSPNIHVALSSELRLDARYWVYQEDPSTPFGELRFHLGPADIFEIYNNGHFFLVPQTSD